MTDLSDASFQGMITIPEKTTSLIRIWNEVVVDKVKTEKEGRPFSHEIPYMSIQSPGNRRMIEITPVTEIEKKKYPEHWEAFLKRDVEVLIEGTLLSEWPGITRSEAENLKHFNVHTLEQLIEMSDTNCQKIRGVHAMRSKAKEYMKLAETQSGAEEIIKSKAVIDRLEEKVTSLIEANKEMGIRLQHTQNAAPAGITQEGIDAMIKKALSSAEPSPAVLAPVSETKPVAKKRVRRTAAQIALDNAKKETKTE